MTYDENDILFHVGPRALEAGRDYRRQRRVLSLESSGDTISAEVRGNARRPYAQDIVIRRSSSGKTAIHSHCSCPVGEGCKHVAAALLERLARNSAPSPSARPTGGAQTPTRPPATPDLPAPLAHWLNELEETRQRASEDYAPGQQQRIVYLLAPQTRHDGGVPRLELAVLTTRLLKDGAFSQRAHAYDWRVALSSSAPAKYLRPSDFRIFRQLMMSHGRYGYYSFESPFADDNGPALLEDILSTGRARWLEVGGPALTRGPARPGRVVWDAGNGVDMRLRLDAGDDLVALNAAPPVYVDAMVGVIGALELGLAPKLAFRLVDAPLAPIEHVARLAERMAQKLPDLASLAPPPPAPPVLYTKPPSFVLRLIRGELPAATPSSSYSPYYGWHAPTETVGLARVVFRYGPVDVDASEAKQTLTRFCDGGLVEVHRDRNAEAEALKTLRANGFVEASRKRPRAPTKHAQDFLPDEDDEFAWLDALYLDLPRLEGLGWRIETDADFPIQLLAPRGDVDAAVRESSGIDWFDLEFGVAVDGETIDLVPPIVAMIRAPDFDRQILAWNEDDGAPFYLSLPDGRFLALPKYRIAPISPRSGNWPAAGPSRAGTDGCASHRSTLLASLISRRRRKARGSPGAAARSCGKWAAS